MVEEKEDQTKKDLGVTAWIELEIDTLPNLDATVADKVGKNSS